MRTTDHPPPARRPNWWKRNWKWFVPVALVVLAAEVTVFVLMLAGGMKNTAAFREALLRVRTDPAVVEAIGSPIEPGFFVAGNIRVVNDTGSAYFEYPVTAPGGRATVTVAATKSAGVWRITRLEVVVAGSEERIVVSTSGPIPEP